MNSCSDAFQSELRQVLLVIFGPGLLSCADLLPPAPLLLFTPKVRVRTLEMNSRAVGEPLFVPLPSPWLTIFSLISPSLSLIGLLGWRPTLACWGSKRCGFCPRLPVTGWREATGTAFVSWVALLEEDIDALLWARMYKKEVGAEGDKDWQFLQRWKLKLNIMRGSGVETVFHRVGKVDLLYKHDEFHRKT